MLRRERTKPPRRLQEPLDRPEATRPLARALARLLEAFTRPRQPVVSAMTTCTPRRLAVKASRRAPVRVLVPWRVLVRALRQEPAQALGLVRRQAPESAPGLVRELVRERPVLVCLRPTWTRRLPEPGW
jgi:hypothetical protein